MNNYDLHRHHVIIIIAVSLGATLMLTVASSVLAVMSKSASTTAFAANCLLDVISSVIMLWRYYEPNCPNSVDTTEQKERKACLYLGIMFIVSALAVIIKAVLDLVQHSITTDIDELILLSISSIAVCVFLTILKFWLYKKLRCHSIFHDAVNSFINTIFAIIIITVTLIIKTNESLWFIDPVISIILAICMLIYGICVILENYTFFQSGKPCPETYSQLA